MQKISIATLYTINIHFSLMFLTVQFDQKVLITTAGINILFSSFEKTSDADEGISLPLHKIKPMNINENKTDIWKITDEKIFIKSLQNN